MCVDRVKLLYEIPRKILRFLSKADGEVNHREVKKNVGSPYKHVHDVLVELGEDGFVERRMDGRENLVSLTEKGERMAEILSMAREMR